MRQPQGKALQRRLREEFQDSFRKKTQLLFDHLWGCIELGASIPQARMRWDEIKQDFSVEVYGPNSKIKKPGVLVK